VKSRLAVPLHFLEELSRHPPALGFEQNRAEVLEGGGQGVVEDTTEAVAHSRAQRVFRRPVEAEDEGVRRCVERPQIARQAFQIRKLLGSK
jgi:hypothetical protein